MWLLVALLLQSAPAPEIAQAHRHTLSIAQRADTAWAEIETSLERQFSETTESPRTGIIVTSDEAPGSDGLHATWVVVVMRDSPALRAGIKEGDRILRIGQRRIEHESTDVVRLFLEDIPGPVEVTVGRDARSIVLTIQRAPLTCLRAAAQSLDTARWLEHARNMRAKIAACKALLEQHPYDAAVIADVGANIVETATMLPQTIEAIKAALNQQTRTFCGPSSE